MHTDLTVFRLAHAMAVHAGQRQAIVAENLANADTPGYRARDIQPFSELHTGDGRPGGKVGSPQVFQDDTPADVNGNSVSVELEMLKAVETKRQHDRALAIYRSSLNVLRTTLGRG